MTEIRLVTNDKERIKVVIDGNFKDLVNILASTIDSDPTFRAIVTTAIGTLVEKEGHSPEPINMN
jgi:hypothetical protein